MFKIKPGDVTVTKSLRIPGRLVQRLDILAKEHDVSFTELVLQCLEYALDELDGQKQAEQNTVREDDI